MGDDDVDSGVGEEAADGVVDQAEPAGEPQGEAVEDTKGQAAEAEATSDEALLKDPTRLLSDYKELQRKLTSDTQSVKDAEENRKLIEELRADKEFQKFLEGRLGGDKKSPDKAPQLEDDDVVLGKDVKAFAEALVSPRLQAVERFMDEQRQRQAEQERDALYAEHPQAKSVAQAIGGKMRQNPALTMSEAYKLVSFDGLFKEKAAGNASRREKASGSLVPDGNGKRGRGVKLDLDEALSATYDSFHR